MEEEIYRQGSILTFEPELFKEVRVIRGPGESFRWSSGAVRRGRPGGAGAVAQRRAVGDDQQQRNVEHRRR